MQRRCSLTRHLYQSKRQTTWASIQIERTEGSKAYIDQLGYPVKRQTTWALTLIEHTEGSEAHIDQLGYPVKRGALIRRFRLEFRG
jgi:hypothetical protein